MSVLDTLGDIGYGYVDAMNAASGMYQNLDKSRTADINATRAERQLGADDSYDVFNATAAANRAGLDAKEAQGNLSTAQAQYKAEPLDPAFRQQIGTISAKYGGLDSPDARRELANLYASRGMVSDADPEYANAQKQQQSIQQQAIAGQKVLAMLKTSGNPAYADIHSIELGEDGKVYGFTGEPDETGHYDVVELPPAAIREYAALSGQTALLGYDLKMQQAAQMNKAAALGKGAQGSVRAALPSPIKTLSPAGINAMRNQLMKDSLAQGMNYDQALAFTEKNLPALVAQVNKLGQQYHSGELQLPLGAAPAQLDPRQLGQSYGARPQVGPPVTNTPSVYSPSMSPTPFSDADYSAPVDALGNVAGNR
jgi:hypothetical protein